ncbi:LysR family transcriptional regulator [Cupriavidus sp. GA3-3]|nr:LysR family transcriptional regulator [Cupriavidus sp. GA3-3]
MPLVRGYRERYRQVELEMNSNEGIIDLLERRTDVAIRIDRLKDSTLHSRLIGNSRVRILATPAYLDTHGQPRKAEDLGRHAPARLQPARVAERVTGTWRGRRTVPDRAGPVVVERRDAQATCARRGRHRLPVGFHDRAGSRVRAPGAGPCAPHAGRAAAGACGLLPQHGNLVTDRVVRRVSDRGARQQEPRARGGDVDGSVISRNLRTAARLRSPPSGSGWPYCRSEYPSRW